MVDLHVAGEGRIQQLHEHDHLLLLQDDLRLLEIGVSIGNMGLVIESLSQLLTSMRKA